VRALLAEASAMAGRAAGTAFETLFLGGGTPSRLEPADFRELLGGLRARFTFQPGVEVSLEGNPEDVGVERLEAWLAGGVNRVSLGVQSLDDAELGRLGRLHGAAGARRAARAVAERFCDWSLDLIFGFPGHGEAAWRRTLAGALELAPPHVSAYHFTPEAGTPRGEAVRAGRVRAPDDSAAATLFETGAEVLENAGFGQYEISNFARAGHQSRHNRLYWRRRPYLGLGPGAVSFWDERRWRNERDAAEYAARVLGGQDWVAEDEEVAGRAELETFMLGLRLAEGVPWEELARFGARGRAWAAAARGLAERGWLVADESGVRVARERRRVTDEIVLRLWTDVEGAGGRVDRAAAGPFE
jgi:oxygen-independent coproporphyrinogen-3 oxidase